jgi:hypothetical protein
MENLLRRDKTRQRFMELGAIALMEKRFPDAEKHYRNAMRMTTERQALTHPDVGECLLKLGDVRMQLNRPEEAVSLYHLAAFVFDRSGTEHASLWLSMNKLFEARQALHDAITRANVEALHKTGALHSLADVEPRFRPIEKPVPVEAISEGDRPPSRFLPAPYTGGALIPL